MQRIGAHVPLRALRQMQGLTAAKLVERLADRGVSIQLNYIYEVELGHKSLRASNPLRVAWAEELGIKPRDIKFEADLRDMIAEADAANEQPGERAA